MTFEIVNKKGDLIHNFEMDNNPFSVGEILNMDVKVHDRNFWHNAKAFMATFEIEKIEHYYREHYGPGDKHRESHSISITVFEIDYEEL